MEMMTVCVGDSKIKPKEIKMKSRAIILDDFGRILIGNYGGVYLLPGGSTDDCESPNETIIRELKEEVGLEFEELTPFMKMEYYQNNYPKREGNVIDRLLITYFYIGNEKYAIKHERELTEKEISDGFTLKFYDVDDIDKILEQDRSLNPRKEYFNQELRMVINQYKEWKLFNEVKSEKIKKRILGIE